MPMRQTRSQMRGGSTVELAGGPRGWYRISRMDHTGYYRCAPGNRGGCSEAGTLLALPR